MDNSLLERILSITKEKGGIADPSKENAGFVAIYNMGIEGFSDKEISDHVKFLKDEGRIQARKYTSFDGDRWYPEKFIDVLKP